MQTLGGCGAVGHPQGHCSRGGEVQSEVLETTRIGSGVPRPRRRPGPSGSQEWDTQPQLGAADLVLGLSFGRLGLAWWQPWLEHRETFYWRLDGGSVGEGFLLMKRSSP
jgi:hypothetical protein